MSVSYLFSDKKKYEPESIHEPSVNIVVAFIGGPIYKIKIT
jgi:hypothetical protein